VRLADTEVPERKPGAGAHKYQSWEYDVTANVGRRNSQLRVRRHLNGVDADPQSPAFRVFPLSC